MNRMGTDLSSKNGPVSSISDLTPASGWEILDCSPTLDRQEIRVICTGNATDCYHLFLDGAEDTVVRLPPTVRHILTSFSISSPTYATWQCGASPFSRIVYIESSDDQSLPLWLRKKVSKTGGPTPEVLSITIDTDFSSV